VASGRRNGASFGSEEITWQASVLAILLACPAGWPALQYAAGAVVAAGHGGWHEAEPEQAVETVGRELAFHGILRRGLEDCVDTAAITRHAHPQDGRSAGFGRLDLAVAQQRGDRVLVEFNRAHVQRLRGRLGRGNGRVGVGDA
jgi:hypothetical protein